MKKAISVLLILAMLIGIVPFVAAAKTVTALPLTTLPADGQSVVIYSAAIGGVFLDIASNGSIAASLATANADGSLTVSEGTGVYKLYANTDGTYHITCGGKYLHTDSAEQLSFKDTAESGTKWRIEEANGYDGYVIINNDFKYNSYDIYLEYYAGAFKCWTCKTMSDIYCFDFYSVDDAADPDNDGYLGVKPNPGEAPADGDKVVIYNDFTELSVGSESMGALNGIASEGAVPGNGALIFDVIYDGSQYYTFEHQGKYLWTNDEEKLMFVDEQSDYTKWYLEELSNGYVIYNKAAKYNTNPVCIEIYNGVFSGWTYNSNEDIFAMKFLKVEDPYALGYVLSPSMAIGAANAYCGVDYEFEVVLDESTKVESIEMTYALNGEEAVAIEPTGVDGYRYTYCVSASALEGKTSMVLSGTATNEYGMKYSDTAEVAILDEPLIVSVSPAANAATGAEKRPQIVANIANCGADPTVTMTLDGASVTPTVQEDQISYQPVADLEDSRHTASVSIVRADGKKAEMTWSFYVGEQILKPYFGQMHSHTDYSDGAGTLEEAYEYAMNAADIDYLFVTDHSNYFDTTSSATTTSYYDLSSLSKSGSVTKWEEAKTTAANYVTDDFLGMYGYEMTWSGGPGHTNTFNTYGVVSRNNSALNNKSNSYAGMHLYNDLMFNANNGLDVNGNRVAQGVKTKYIEDAPVVSQLNHPGTTFGNFDDYAGCTAERDSVINLLEVGNGSGSVVGTSYWPSYSEYDLCLSKGWHVAPTNNQDNHNGMWGDSNTCRDVVLADEFTEAAIYRAMSERRVYATEDQNLEIFYYLNDLVMGTISEDTPEIAHITASISDPDGEELGTVEIIGENGASLMSIDVIGSVYALDAELVNTEAYYYLKVTQADGDIAVTAPVWVGAAPTDPSEEPSEPSEEPTEPSEEPTEPETDPDFVAKNEVDFRINDDNGNRLIRSQETNLGDFAADALYYLFDNMGQNVDVAIVNGGAIRADMPVGDITNTLLATIHPYGDIACLHTITGQQLLDALEWGVRNVGVIEEGGFLHVSGVTFEIHSYITSTVQSDTGGTWLGAPTGEYRVKNVKVGGEPLDLTATYNIAGSDYLLSDLGDGYTMFSSATCILDNIMADNLVLANYAKSFPDLTIKADNSVLGANYADIYGEGRISVIAEAPEEPSEPSEEPTEPSEEPTEPSGELIGYEFVLSETVEPGDEVVIVCAARNNAFSSEKSDYYNTGVSVTPVDGKLLDVPQSIVWTVGEKDGAYTFAQDGRTIGMADTYTSLNFDMPHDTWLIENAHTEGASFVRNIGRDSYLEWYETYSHWCAYHDNSDEALFAMNFYVKQAIYAEPSEPQVDENLKFSMNISAGAEMVVNYSFMASVVSNYTDFYLEIKKDVAGGEAVITSYGCGEGRTPIGVMNHPATGEPLLYNASYTGIVAKEMGDNFATTLYATTADGKIFRGETVVSSIKDFLIGKLEDSASIPEMKTMAVDMLKYGAAAQVNFAYDAENLVTDALSEAQLALGTQEIPEAVNSTASSGSGANISTSITVGSKVELTLSCIVAGLSDPSGVKCIVTDKDGKILAELATENKAGVMFSAKYDNVGAREMRKMISATFYNAAGEAITQTLSWNVESYVAQIRAKTDATETEIAMVNAMLTYGDSVAAYMTAAGQ